MLFLFLFGCNIFLSSIITRLWSPGPLDPQNYHPPIQYMLFSLLSLGCNIVIAKENIAL